MPKSSANLLEKASPDAAIADESHQYPQRIFVPGRGVGKGRPIVTQHGTYYSDNYRNWKDFTTAWVKQHLKPIEHKVKVDCQFVDFASSDCDNLIGSVMDALVKSEVLKNDSSGYVTGCSGVFVKTRKKRGKDRPVGTIIDISPRQIEEIILENDLTERIVSIDADKNLHRIFIPGRGVGKGRPIVTKYGTYYSDNYKNWKDFATSWVKHHLNKIKFKCRIDCQFVNFASSDSDNLIGSAMDALVKGGIIENDSSGYVTGCSGVFTKTRKKRGKDKPVGIIVDISPRQIENVLIELY